MKINPATIQLIKEFEGFRAETYLDSVKVPTIGYGTTASAGVGIVPKPGMKISEAQATEYLIAALNKFAGQIAPLLKREPTENQYGAMMSLAYNIGPTGFARSSVLRRFNEGNIPAAADAFLLWNKAGGRVLKGLVRRREAERALFLTADGRKPSAATPEPPKPDTPASGSPAGLLGLILRLLAALFGRR
jgi:lysozyme